MADILSATTSSAVFDWLLERDDPAVRAVALRDLLGAPPDDADYQAACTERLARGPVAEVLAAMNPEGYWERPDRSYSPKYTATFWAITLLGQLGVTVGDDDRVARACARLLDQSVTLHGQIGYNNEPSGTFDCLQGNICHALLQMGVDDPRLDRAIDWMARTVTGDGIADADDKKNPRRYFNYKCGPGFACLANNGLPCAWGATKVMLALASLPHAQRTPQVDAALVQGAEFLLSVEPVTAAWPTHDGSAPSPKWWKFGFPVFYTADLLQMADALTALGCGGDPRLAATLDLIRAKRDAQGRWPLEFSYGSKTLARFGRVNAPSKWVTLRALRVLKAVEGIS